SATFLVSTKPSYHGGCFRRVSQRMIPTWMQLAESVRSGGATVGVNQHGQGEDFFHELVEDMFALSYAAAQALGETLMIAEVGEIKEHNGARIETVFAVDMLLHTLDGDTFSLEEMRDWLVEVGFTKVSSLNAAAQAPLILANSTG